MTDNNPLPPESGPTLDFVPKAPTPDSLPVEGHFDELIGPYKLLEQLGHGGMGEVWLAEQSEPVRRRVALKLIKAGMDTQQVLARFEAERQALALMDHPNIAKVLDAGRTDAGRPYFVMELVKGTAVTAFCDRERLSLRERLELFIPVCQAVQHAHQKGIIHRDLKPSNILVGLSDGKPTPKIIDFGVAKAISQKLTERTLYTAVGMMVGTPEYMAPEQAEANNVDIDTRADVYSLGVVLYELLAGSPPFASKQLRNAAFDEMLRVIREVEPPKPSTKLSSSDELPNIAVRRKTEPKRLTKSVQGDLDWIVMKCLEKERARRYETANGLGMDIQRYLDDEAVLAGPPSRSYRLRKFVRRNKGAVIAASVMALLLAGGIAANWWQAHRTELARLDAVANENRANQERDRADEEKRIAQQERDRADQEKQIAQAVLGFVENKIFAAARPETQDGGLGHAVTLRNAIEAALPFVDKSFTQQPLIEARLRRTLGVSFSYLGDAKIAVDQFQAARSLSTQHLGPDHPDTLKSMHNLAHSYAELGRHVEAVKLREETLALYRAKYGPDHPDTLASMMGLSASYADLGQHVEAIKLRMETLALQKAKLGPDHPNTLGSMNNLAISYGDLGRHIEALELRETTLALLRAKLGPDHPHTLSGMTNLARSYTALGRHADALKLCEETLALQKAKLGPDHPSTLKSMANLAISYHDLGRHADALKLGEETLELMKAKLGPDHPSTLQSMANLAISYRDLGRHADALKLCEETLALRKSKLGPEHPDTFKSMWNLAGSLVQLDRGAEAVLVIDECWNRAAGKAVDPRLIPSVMHLRLRHFEKTKDAAGCRATAEMWEKLNRTDANILYQAARIRAVTATVLRTNSPEAGATRLADAEADKAMDWLKQAVAAGHKDVGHMTKDKDLDPLRDREDFKKLLADLEAKVAAEKKAAAEKAGGKK